MPSHRLSLRIDRRFFLAYCHFLGKLCSYTGNHRAWVIISLSYHSTSLYCIRSAESVVCVVFRSPKSPLFDDVMGSSTRVQNWKFFFVVGLTPLIPNYLPSTCRIIGNRVLSDVVLPPATVSAIWYPSDRKPSSLLAAATHFCHHLLL